MIIKIIIFLWFLKMIKAILFWLYLWQLKNYHFGRFLAHFRTDAGKRIIINLSLLLIFLIIIGLTINYTNPLLVVGFSIIYILDCLRNLIALLTKKFKRPEFTKKIMFLMFFSVLPFIIIWFGFSSFNLISYEQGEIISYVQSLLLLFLLFEFLVPLYVTFVVLLFQPITIILRNRTINRASEKRKKLDNLLTIGITGSYGKSSVKEFLKTTLSESFRVVTTEENKNSEMGISEAILKNVNEKHEIFLCEMGAYNRGGIKLLCSIARPKIGIITGINSQHLATFGSQENIIKAKFELIDCLPDEGLAVLNWESELVRNNFKRDIANIKYGQDVWAEDVVTEKNRVKFKACFKNGKSVKIEANVIGSQNIINLLCVIAVAKKLGMDFEEIVSGIKKIKQNNLSSFNGVDYLNFSYSSNPSSVLAHLEHLKLWQGKKIIIMQCLIELGTNSVNTHAEIGKKIDEICDLAIITSSECFKYLKSKKAVCLNSPNQIHDMIRANSSFESVVLLEGRIPDKIINLLKK
jgi:UDP-N-acetylmuramoyl-tripeptide--D-alanyl-D-alanine ligase